MGYLRIFLTKNPLNFFLLNVTKFHGDSVKNESARTKKTKGGVGGVKRPLLKPVYG